MAFQAPWSPTAHAFAQHQFTHVTNFWKQGRPARFRLEALPGGKAELNLTFQLPPASEVIPPPYHVPPVPRQRPIQPLFPHGYFPQGSGGVDSKTKKTRKKSSSRLRKSYQRSVLHRAALAAPSLPPPKNGSLRQAALASLQRTPSANKRPFPDSPNTPSPSHLPPLAQRIRSDFQIGEGEVESPEKEVFRSQLPENSPAPLSPCSKSIPSPTHLVFTPVPKEDVEVVVNESEHESDSEDAYDESDSEDEVSAKEDEVVGKSVLSEWNLAKGLNEWHEAEAEQWSQRLEKRTDDSALKSRLLEVLEEAYRTPASDLPDRDLVNLFEPFEEGDLSPVQFLEKLQSLLR